MQEERKEKRKKRSLAVQFGFFYVAFALVTILISAAMTYGNQMDAYHKECENNLRMICNQLAVQINREGSEFKNLKTYFMEHPDRVWVPVNFADDMPEARHRFFEYVSDTYPGQSFGQDLKFADLDEQGQQLYVNWRFEYWFTLFYDTCEKHELSYIYFVYPTEGKENYVTYMFDPSLFPYLFEGGTDTEAMSRFTRKDDDGRDILMLGDDAFEDPEEHAVMWEAWYEGSDPQGFDAVDNEYGYVYTYCVPLVLNGEKVGLICADEDVLNVNTSILIAVLRQTLVMIVVLLVSLGLMAMFVRTRVLSRIIKLEKHVHEYSEVKDKAVAYKIKQSITRLDELGSLSEEFAGMIDELEDYMKNLQTVTAEKERIGAELDVATNIQASMLPRIFPPFPQRSDIDLYATMDPAKEVGGDFYDFFLLDDDHLAVVMADVSGKGVPAALIMVIARTLIRNHILAGESVEEALTVSSAQLLENNDEMLFVTAWAGIIDLKTGEVEFSDAGHEPAYVLHQDGTVTTIKPKKKRPPLATVEGMKFLKDSFTMVPGDRLYLYTDGVPEATNLDEQLYDKERLEAFLAKHTDLDSEHLLRSVREDVDLFVGTAPQFDDMTMLAVQWKGEQ
ncbi:MAG: SpoIIE family protein phosphatase [Lachnospiraceae bacterium]|nr:SpoIIE family protein phosphatase [Lachnospiraceae bacterium]